jgi:hypothetical protein
MFKQREDVLMDRQLANTKRDTVISGVKPARRNRFDLQTGSLDAGAVFFLAHPYQNCPLDIHAVIEDALDALPQYIQQGYTIAVEPFESGAGKCAVIQDRRGTRICITETDSKTLLTQLSDLKMLAGVQVNEERRDACLKRREHPLRSTFPSTSFVS